MRDDELYCDVCGDVRLFEQPPCVDGHDADCPELACTACGAALLVATAALGAPAGRPVVGIERRAAASPTRRAGHAA